MQLLIVCRTKKRDRRRITGYMCRRDTEQAKPLIKEIEELDQEVDQGIHSTEPVYLEG